MPVVELVFDVPLVFVCVVPVVVPLVALVPVLPGMD